MGVDRRHAAIDGGARVTIKKVSHRRTVAMVLALYGTACDKGQQPSEEVEPTVPAELSPAAAPGPAPSNKAPERSTPQIVEKCELDGSRDRESLMLLVTVRDLQQEPYIYSVHCSRQCVNFSTGKRIPCIDKEWYCNAVYFETAALTTGRIENKHLWGHDPEVLAPTPSQVRILKTKWENRPKHVDFIERHAGVVDDKTRFWLEGYSEGNWYFLDFKHGRSAVMGLSNKTTPWSAVERPLGIECKDDRYYD